MKIMRLLQYRIKNPRGVQVTAQATVVLAYDSEQTVLKETNNTIAPAPLGIEFQTSDISFPANKASPVTCLQKKNAGLRMK